MLQVELNESLRKKIVDELFIKYVSASETIFAKELYLSIDQIKTMLKFGMHIGAHGYDHYWLGSLTMEKQKIEIFKSLEFLLSLGIKKEYWTMCYPYGSFNQDTIDILNNFNCKAAFTTEVRIANIILENKLTLPRLDTNDFPSDVNSPYCHT
jgi:peptidoglycan/xylan/chitin deacetylase (PgdA/CDA1 family)